MIDTLLTIAGLGVAGIDPIGAMLLLSGITAGAGRAKLTAFTVGVFVTSVAVGVGLAVAGGRLIDTTTQEPAAPPGAVWAYVELAIAVVILGWLFRKATRKDRVAAKAKKPRRLDGSVGAFALAGIAFTATSVADPTFLATAGVVGRSDNLLVVVSSFVVWTLISQSMLFVLFAAFLFGVHEGVIDAAQAQWNRHRRWLIAALYAALVIVASVLIADAAFYFLQGTYLL